MFLTSLRHFPFSLPPPLVSWSVASIIFPEKEKKNAPKNNLKKVFFPTGSSLSISCGGICPSIGIGNKKNIGNQFASIPLPAAGPGRCCDARSRNCIQRPFLPTQQTGIGFGRENRGGDCAKSLCRTFFSF